MRLVYGSTRTAYSRMLVPSYTYSLHELVVRLYTAVYALPGRTAYSIYTISIPYNGLMNLMHQLSRLYAVAICSVGVRLETPGPGARDPSDYSPGLSPRVHACRCRCVSDTAMMAYADA